MFVHTSTPAGHRPFNNTTIPQSEGHLLGWIFTFPDRFTAVIARWTCDVDTFFWSMCVVCVFFFLLYPSYSPKIPPPVYRDEALSLSLSLDHLLLLLALSYQSLFLFSLWEIFQHQYKHTHTHTLRALSGLMTIARASATHSSKQTGPRRRPTRPRANTLCARSLEH